MKIKVGVLYTAIASVEIDVQVIEGTSLPVPEDVRDLMRNRTPELLRTEEQQLVSVDSVLVGDEEIVVDVDFG